MTTLESVPSTRDRLKARNAANRIDVPVVPDPVERVPCKPVPIKKEHKRWVKPATNQVGDLIDDVCRRTSMTHHDLADLIALDRSFMAGIRSGARNPTYQVLLRIAERWPLTADETVALFRFYRMIPPGYDIVRMEMNDATNESKSEAKTRSDATGIGDGGRAGVQRSQAA